MSPIHSFDLSNFSDTPNEVLETHSPYMCSTQQQNTPSPNTSPSSGEDGADSKANNQKSAAGRALFGSAQSEKYAAGGNFMPANTFLATSDDCPTRTGAPEKYSSSSFVAAEKSPLNEMDESGLRRPSDSAMSDGSRRSSGHDVHDDSDSSKHGHADVDERSESVNNVNSASASASASAVTVEKQFESLLSGSDSLVDSQIARGDLNVVGDDQFEIDTNHSTLNFDCFGTVNDDVMESAFDEGVLGGVDCEKSSANNAESGEQRRRDAENSDDDDSGDDSDDSSENDDDSSDSDDSDEESNTPNDEANKANASAAAASSMAATAEKTDGDGASDQKDDKTAVQSVGNDSREKNVDADAFDSLETKRAKDGDGVDGHDAKHCETEGISGTEGGSKSATNALTERNPADGNENSNISRASIASHADDDTNDGNGPKLTSSEATGSSESASTSAKERCGEESGDKLGDGAKIHIDALKMSMDGKRIKSEPNSRNISPQHRSDGGNGNHSADELLMGSKEKSPTKMSIAIDELRKNAKATDDAGGTKAESSAGTRNLLDAAMDILRDAGDDKSSDHFGLGADASDALESGAHLGDSPGINLDDSVNLESLDAVANLLNTDLDLDSDDNHDIFGALDNDQLDSISDSNSEDGIGHSTSKELKLEASVNSTDDKSSKTESATIVDAAPTIEEAKNALMEVKSLPSLDYKSWLKENAIKDELAGDAVGASVKSEIMTLGDGEASSVEKSSAIDALVTAPLLASIKRELDCNEAMSNDTEEDSNGNDFHAAIELELKRHQPADAVDSIVKEENDIESNGEKAVAVAAASGTNDEASDNASASEKNRNRSEKVEASGARDDKSDRNNNSDRNRRGKKRTRPQYHEPTILRPTVPFNFECLANRPTLQSHTYESFTNDDATDLNQCMLYDYSTLEAWMNHPVKRFKANEPMKPVRQTKTALQDLYAQQVTIAPNPTKFGKIRTDFASSLPPPFKEQSQTTQPASNSCGESVTAQSNHSDDEDSNGDGGMSPSNLSELSPYGNIDILDPEDLDCFSEEFVHVSYRAER